MYGIFGKLHASGRQRDPTAKHEKQKTTIKTQKNETLSI